jgi:hypothetical protein
MIQLKRKRTATAIPIKYRGQQRIEQALKLLDDSGQKRTFEEKYWKGAKKQLKIESGNKCAYCEASTAVVAHGDVEHFRPKSVYWWLAYCYDNYLYACQICNQTYKSDLFPVVHETGRMQAPPLPPGLTDTAKRALAQLLAPDPLDKDAGQSWDEHERLCRDEQALLLNPYTDKPEEHLKWEADPVLKEVEVVARKGNDPNSQNTIECYGLNREELRAERWKVFRSINTICQGYLKLDPADPLRQETQETLQDMMDGTAPFAAMCRYVVREIHKFKF